MRQSHVLHRRFRSFLPPQAPARAARAAGVVIDAQQQLDGQAAPLLVGGGERGLVDPVGAQHAHHAEAVELGHLEVEQREVGALALDELHRLGAALALDLIAVVVLVGTSGMSGLLKTNFFDQGDFSQRPTPGARRDRNH